MLGASAATPAAAPQNGPSAVALLNDTLFGNAYYLRLVQAKGGIMTMGARTDSNLQTYATLGGGELVNEFLQGYGKALLMDVDTSSPSYRFYSAAIAAGAKCTPAAGPF
ncbi:hypothetical protein ABPG75_002457 [Micractinium tetrahymenae]